MAEERYPELAECLSAFAVRDYLGCYTAAMEGHEQPLDHPVRNHLIAICMHRLGQATELAGLSRVMLDAEADPWEQSLLRLTFGLRELEDVRDQATDATQRCRATFYAGARQLTLGRLEVARQLLHECAGHQADCVERELAALELAALATPGGVDTVEQTFELFRRRAAASARGGNFREAVRLAEEACDLARRTWGQDGIHFAKALAVLLIGLSYAGRTQEALEVAPIAIDRARRYFTDSSDLADVLNSAAYVHKVTDDLEVAISLYEEAAELWGASATPDIQLSVVLNNIAQLEIERGNVTRAEALFHRVLDQLKGSDDEGLYGGVMNNLALLYQKKGDLDGSVRLHLQALEHRREKLGDGHPEYAASLNNLAQVYKEQGRFAEAEPLFRQAADILERTVGIRHRHTLMTLSALIEIYEATGQAEAVDQLMARLRSEAEAPRAGVRHILHPEPGPTPMFRGLRSGMPQLTNELDAPGGALDWRSPSYQQMFEQLADDFVEGRYGSCLPRAILLNAYDTTVEGLLIYLLCFAQASETDGGPALPTEVVAAVHQSLGQVMEDPWHRELVDVVNGCRDPADLADLVDDAQFCQLLYYVGHLQLATGDTDGALASFSECATSGIESFEVWMAQRILRRAPRASDERLAARVRQLNGSAADMLSRGDFAGAVETVEQAWELASGLEETAPERTTSQYQLAMVIYKGGDLSRAESLLLSLVSVMRAAEHYDRVTVAGVLNLLGIIYTDLATFEKAEPVLLDALAELQLAGPADDPNAAQIKGNLAELYREMGDMEKAVQIGLEALKAKEESLGRSHPEYARTLNNLGAMYMELDDLEAAEAALDEAYRIRRSALPAGHDDLATSEHNRACLYLRQERYDEAETALRTSLEISRSNGAPALSYATRSALLASLYHLTGRLDEAAEQLIESREILERSVGELHPYVAVVLSNLAAVKADAGDMAGALALAKKSEEATSRLLSGVFSTASERQRLRLLGDTHVHLSGYLSMVAALGRPDAEIAAAFELVLRRKGIVNDVQAALNSAVNSAQGPELRAMARQLRSLREKIARKSLAGAGPEGLSAHREILAAWTVEQERIEAAVARHVPDVWLEQRLREPSEALLRSSLPPESALIEIVRFARLPFAEDMEGHHRYWAFVLRPEPVAGLRLIDLGEAEPIDALIADYRAAVVGRGVGRDIESEPADERPPVEEVVGTRLRSAVLNPLLATVGTSRRLFISPDGDLSQLPWEALPLDANRRVIDDYDISYLGTGRDLLRVAVPSSQPPTAPLVVADPDFDVTATGARAAMAAAPGTRDLRGSGMRFARLDGTRDEGRAVAAMLGVEPLTGAAATDTAVKSCRHPVILHIATHGFFRPDPRPAKGRTMSMPGTGAGFFGRLSNADLSPFLRSGLALAGANTWLAGGIPPSDAEDGILTAEDVSSMDLVGTELVTLSACETGLGSQHVGEGVLGLRRAFIAAGARTVVMSLWRVPDAETQVLMTSFYQEVLNGAERATALRKAQQDLRKQQPNPYFWGAFICQGDPGRLSLMNHGDA